MNSLLMRQTMVFALTFASFAMSNWVSIKSEEHQSIARVLEKDVALLVTVDQPSEWVKALIETANDDINLTEIFRLLLYTDPKDGSHRTDAGDNMTGLEAILCAD